jgi:putative tryptophan/tyrosine transport system substrate-binding protein
MIKRRSVVRAMALGAASLARAQPTGKPARIGVLRPAPDDAVFRRSFQPFIQALHDAKLDDGANLAIVYRVRPGSDGEARTMADELVKSGVDAILAVGPAGVRAASRATSSVPIVAVDQTSDPVEAGFAASLARPGGNVTGLFVDFPELSGKYVQLLKELLPGLQRAAMLWDPATGPFHLRAIETAAAALHVSIVQCPARRADDIAAAVQSATTQQAQALLSGNSPIFNSSKKRVAELALAQRLPTLMPYPDFVDDGGLMSYGVYVSSMFQQAGAVMAKVLRGTKPQDIPIERPTRTELAINRTTAKALGLTIPASMLARVDRVVD